MLMKVADMRGLNEQTAQECVKLLGRTSLCTGSTPTPDLLGKRTEGIDPMSSSTEPLIMAGGYYKELTGTASMFARSMVKQAQLRRKVFVGRVLKGAGGVINVSLY